MAKFSLYRNSMQFWWTLTNFTTELFTQFLPCTTMPHGAMRDWNFMTWRCLCPLYQSRWWCLGRQIGRQVPSMKAHTVLESAACVVNRCTQLLNLFRGQPILRVLIKVRQEPSPLTVQEINGVVDDYTGLWSSTTKHFFHVDKSTRMAQSTEDETQDFHSTPRCSIPATHDRRKPQQTTKSPKVILREPKQLSGLWSCYVVQVKGWSYSPMKSS